MKVRACGFLHNGACVEWRARKSAAYCNGINMGKNAKPDTKQLRAIGHKLKPVVTVAGNGLSDAVVAEIDAALTRHELIKVKLAVGSRDNRDAVAQDIHERTGCDIVQQVGNIVLVLRRSAKPDPKLSNLIRIV
jgi:RNA-binding protein